jgi:hypothetical protein
MISLYSWKSIQRLQDELHARTLRNDGKKEDLVRRLREADWDKRLRQHDTFPPFPRLPIEIQRKIWGFSLPGPRLLSVFFDTYDPSRLFKPFRNQRPKPVMLTTCLISHEVALLRYRPVFEYSTFYADLRGGEVINLGYYNNQLDTDMIRSWGSTKVIADLEQITQNDLHLEYLRSYIPGWFDLGN